MSVARTASSVIGCRGLPTTDDRQRRLTTAPPRPRSGDVRLDRLDCDGDDFELVFFSSTWDAAAHPGCRRDHLGDLRGADPLAAGARRQHHRRVGRLRVAAYAATSSINVISDGAPSLSGGPQYPVPRLT